MFQGKVCVVTNGAKGIGRCVIEEFAKRGCIIAYMDMDRKAGKQLQKYLWTDYGVDAFFFHGSVCSEQDLELFAGAIIGQYERVDYFIHNTCVNKKSFPEEKGCSGYNFTIKSGVKALYTLSSTFMDYYREGASIVTIVSDRDCRLQNGEETSQKKGAIATMTRALAVKYDGKIRVNSVNPCVESKDTVIGSAKPFDTAQTAFFLCEEKADFLNGENLDVDGSMTRMMLCKDKNGWSFIE